MRSQYFSKRYIVRQAINHTTGFRSQLLNVTFSAARKTVFLPPSGVNAEYAAWKTLITVNQQFKDANVVKTLNTLNSDTYPAIYTLLRILSVIPVSIATGNSTN